MTDALKPGRVEKSGIVVTGILTLVNIFLGSKELAYGVAMGGILVVANFLGIRLLVGALLGGAYSQGFSMSAIFIKMAFLIALAVVLFTFTNVNIYGFLIGVTGVVLVIIGEGLRGRKDGSL